MALQTFYSIGMIAIAIGSSGSHVQPGSQLGSRSTGISGSGSASGIN
ncbi:hypothetical protein BN871_CY_00050 [Paenibacillus sp. P22]|nr:hypothetical protein BN871_CY_00050 [Paenibacillus sp. P22]